MTQAENRWLRWPEGVRRGIAYGADYNPEQWTPEDWAEDVALMQRAGVTIVNVAVFGWSLIEPENGVYEFGLFERVLDLMHASGIAVDLGTATSSPPAWLVAEHPEMLPVDARGHVLGFGGRQSYCPSSPVYRKFSLRLVREMAAHFGSHPALAAWHVSNELGCHNSRCYCDVSEQAFRRWLQQRYADIDTLNTAWGTAFWSQRYGRWEHVPVPRLAPTYPNPTQQLDFARFCSDELLGQFLAERAVLRELTPDIPVTTNFMVMWSTENMDYAAWAPELDFVSNDHYLREGDPEPEIELAFSADLTRGVAQARPWMLMEQSTSAVNWGRVNRPKVAGELRRNSLAQVARGADAISYFQWRASRAGAEKFHSAMLPHAGADTRVFREVEELGADLRALEEVVGSRVHNEVAVLHDWPAHWAGELDSHPSQRFRYRDTVLSYYRPLWRAGIGVDVLPPTGDWSTHRVLVIPGLYLVDDETVARIDAFAEAGGTVVVTYFSGIVDEFDHIRTGGYPGAFRDLLGVRVEEFVPLREDESVDLDDGTRGTLWSEYLQAPDADVRVRYASGPSSGQPAVTARTLSGGGMAWYCSTHLGEEALGALLRSICADAGVAPLVEATGALEVSVRSHGDGSGSYVFALNHGTSAAGFAGHGTDLLTGREHAGTVVVGPGEVVVLKRSGG